MKKCEICSANVAKYKCPGCLAQTCSLPCVKRHKADMGCNGQRKKTNFVTKKDYTDGNLLNDYRFLEETNRKVDSTQRDRLKQRSNKPNFLIKLVKEARKRGINLKIMPYPMAKRKHNMTMYQHKLQTIFWNVQWLFPQSKAKFTSKRLSEHLTLEELLKVFVHPTESDPVKRHALKVYGQKGLQNCRLFMKVEERPANDVRFHELCLKKSLQKNLVGKCIVEYPTIHVVLEDHCQHYSVLDTVTDSDFDDTSCSMEEVTSSPLSDKCQVVIRDESNTPTDCVVAEHAPTQTSALCDVGEPVLSTPPTLMMSADSSMTHKTTEFPSDSCGTVIDNGEQRCGEDDTSDETVDGHQSSVSLTHSAQCNVTVITN
ncbi:box C/D snoRNA protein 1-like [Mizuhopecten yessoensis]|uniref:box C/D snoRNA protein 1-like n=1 Tax=Mizuhopecten yessoensis TaxID=6573 RepID=UPI000B45DD93|nr:box C/D snoRNA protein 1-like [Mizuhopecten yessoensis]